MIDNALAALESAAAAYDEARGRVAKGEEWLATHQKAHRQYRAAQTLLAQRRRELTAADARLTAAEDALQAATDGLSLRCEVCGEVVTGVPPLQPGHHVHLSCWGEEETT